MSIKQSWSLGVAAVKLLGLWASNVGMLGIPPCAPFLAGLSHHEQGPQQSQASKVHFPRCWEMDWGSVGPFWVPLAMSLEPACVFLSGKQDLLVVAMEISSCGT